MLEIFAYGNSNTLPIRLYFATKSNCCGYRLSFINTLCTRSERNLPILMENNKNHRMTLPKGRIGFSSLDVLDRDELRYQKRKPYELTNAIISTDERYNDCFLLHSTVPAQSTDEFLLPKIRSSSNLIQFDIAFLLMLE